MMGTVIGVGIGLGLGNSLVWGWGGVVEAIVGEDFEGGMESGVVV